MLTQEVSDWSRPDRNQEEEDPGNLGVGSEWRSRQSEAKDDLVVEALQAITERLRNISAPAPTAPELEFSGEPVEDPGQFLTEFESWCRHHRIPGGKWPVTMKKCMRGLAGRWYADVQTQSWPLIRTLFMQRFDSEALQTGLWGTLYGEPQDPGERVAPFIMKKWSLFQRLAPGTPVARKLGTVIELLTPEIRKFCRTVRVGSLEDLLELTIKLEDIWKERAERKQREKNPEPVPTPRRPQQPPGDCETESTAHFDNACPRDPRGARGRPTEGTTSGG